MAGPQGDVGALIFAHQFLDTIFLHHRRAFDHHPVLGPVVVHLQRQAGARLDLDLLDLPAFAFDHAVVVAPRTIDAAMGLAFGGAFPFQPAHDRLHLLGPVTVGHEHHVIGFDHHEIVHAQPHDQPVFAAQVAVAGVFADHPAAQHVARPIPLARFPQGGPATHIAPFGIERQHGAEAGFFHHGHIEGHVGAVGEGFPLQPQEFQVGTVVVQGGAAGTHHLGGESFELRQDGAGAEQEHAAVPGEAPGGEEGFGRAEVGLFDEAGDRHGDQDCSGLVGCAIAGLGIRQGERCGRFDVAVAGFRRGGHDAEAHQPAGLGGGDAGGHGGAESLGLVDDVVGGQHQQQRVGAAGAGLEGRHGHGGSGVTTHRLQQNAGGFHVDLAHLLSHDEAVVFVADQQRGRQGRQPLEALVGLLKQRFITAASQGPVLLGIAGPR